MALERGAGVLSVAWLPVTSRQSAVAPPAGDELSLMNRPPVYAVAGVVVVHLG